jgi:alkylation response protein AidB-like acyl-CoA dehydrogenase
MSQPNNYGFEEEARLLKDSARRLFGEKLPVDRCTHWSPRTTTRSGNRAPAWRDDLWREMVELGWTSLAVPESAAGGSVCPGWPWPACWRRRDGPPCPRRFCPRCRPRRYSPRRASGHAALEEICEGRCRHAGLPGRQRRGEPGAVRAEDGKLYGEAHFVQEAPRCERLLVLAAGEGGSALYWVDARRRGADVQSDPIVDLTRDQARVRFDGVDAHCLSEDADRSGHAAEPALWTLASADMVGAAEWQLQTTVEYAQQRQQFDRPLGFFQAVKHQLVNVMMAIDESKSLLYSAACALDHEPAPGAAARAHGQGLGERHGGAFASGRSVQCHGGIGFTWECYVHLYFKRQKHSQRCGATRPGTARNWPSC